VVGVFSSVLFRQDTREVSQYSLHAPPKVDLGLFVLVLGLWRLAPLQQLQQTMTRGGGRPPSQLLELAT
jgi:hypothetical protein